MSAFVELDTQVKERLWDHQRNAAEFAVSHLQRNDSPCLIRMPTGTGKTGVIGVLTCLSCQGTSLVVTPWANLRDQLVADLSSRFWGKIGARGPKREVQELLPSKAGELLDSNKGPMVLVSTFSTLTTLSRDYRNVYRSLAKKCHLVVVDECHYEPAVRWGRAVKELETKTVLLTATPYRNDLKLFRISDPQNTTFHFTHHEAETNGIIRKIEFGTLQSKVDTRALAAEFVVAWKRMLRDKALPSSDPRAIICCETSSDIETAVVVLRNKGLNAIGIHDRFSGESADHFRKHVPDPNEEPAPIWVHQKKLTEGLDDSRFCLLALFTEFGNDRKLVQQIGRIMRSDAANNTSNPALVLVPQGHTANKDWEAYRTFETKLELLDPAHFRAVVENLLKYQPEVEYFAGRFLEKFDPDTLGQDSQVIVPPSALVRRTKDSFKISDYIEHCTDTLNLDDAVILGPDINGPCAEREDSALWVYASVTNSSILFRRSFYQIGLETHCVVLANEYVFIADTRRNFPTEYLDEHTLPVGAETLGKYFDESFRPTSTSIHNTIPFESAIKGQEIRGSNLSAIAPTITDRIHIIRSTRGRSSGENESRYVGLGNGRVRKETSGSVRNAHDYDVFVNWARKTADVLDSTVSSNEYFSRYMPACDPPSEVEPKSISLDLHHNSVAFQFPDGTPCVCENPTAEIAHGSKARSFNFQITFQNDDGKNDRKAAIRFFLTYKPEKARFWLTKDDNSESIRVAVLGNETRRISLAQYLNAHQDSLLICLDGGETVYQGQSFYRVDYDYAEKSLLNCIATPLNASPCKSEKGTERQIKNLKDGGVKEFAKASLFREVAEEKCDLPFTPELIICDDLGSEAADFIAVDFSSRKLAFVHVKVGDGKQISASAFHDVTAQALKNLCYMVPRAAPPEGASNSWTRSSKWNKTDIPRLYKAPPKSLPTGVDLWEEIRSKILEASDRELYIVLVTAGCVSRKALSDAIQDKKKRTHQTGQLLHLLDGLNSQARQLGVTLLVKDVPYKK